MVGGFPLGSGWFPAGWIVIYSGGTVTSTTQEKCNLENIDWLNVDEPSTEPSELNYSRFLFILNKPLLSFLRERQNHRWMKFLDDIAEKHDCVNNLSNAAGNLQVVIFAGLTGEDLDGGEKLFQGLEKIHLEQGQDLDSVLMEILVRDAGSTAVTRPSQGAAATASHSRSECQFAAPPHLNQVTLSSTLSQVSTAAVSGGSIPAGGLQDIMGTSTQYSRQGATGQILSNSLEHMPVGSRCIAPSSGSGSGPGPASSYVRGYTNELDATRSLSSYGLAMEHLQSIAGPTDIHAPSPITPPSPVHDPDGNDVAYIPVPVAELRISLDDLDLHTPQGESAPLSALHSVNRPTRGRSHHFVHVPPFNITPDRSLDDNNSSWPMTSYNAGLGTEGGACHMDPKPQPSSLSADKASGLFDDDSLVIDLPTNVMQYLTSEMDIGPNYGKGWVELAALKNYIFSRVIRIKGNQSIQSPFQYLLGQQEFSGYTYGQLKRDLQILPRLDILRKLQSGNFI